MNWWIGAEFWSIAGRCKMISWIRSIYEVARLGVFKENYPMVIAIWFVVVSFQHTDRPQ